LYEVSRVKRKYISGLRAICTPEND